MLDKLGLCFCKLILRHQHPDLMLNGDCRRKFDLSSEPVRAHVAPLWLNPLDMYDWTIMTAETL